MANIRDLAERLVVLDQSISGLQEERNQIMRELRRERQRAMISAVREWSRENGFGFAVVRSNRLEHRNREE